MHSLRYCLFFLLLLAVNFQANAQSVADMWISIPDEFAPYLSLNQRKEMIECQKIGVDTSVKNKFEGTTSIDTLTTDYGKFIMSESRTLEIAILPCGSDNIVMLIDSYIAPEVQGKVSFYDTQWNRIANEGKIPTFGVDDLLQKPDTMSIRDYDDLKKLIVDGFIEYNYDSTSHELEIGISLPLVTLKEKEQLNAVICKRKLKWSGNSFN